MSPRKDIDKLERLLKIRVKLSKDPVDYAVNNPNKKIAMLLGAKAGDVIWYYKTDGDKKKAEVSINPQEIGTRKYKECSWLQSRMHLKF